MTKTQNKASEINKDVRKKPYKRPKLSNFGAIKELTKGGAGGSPEANMGDKAAIRFP